MNSSGIKTALNVIQNLPSSGLIGRQTTDAISAVRTVVKELTGCYSVDEAALSAFLLDDLSELNSQLRRLPEHSMRVSRRSMLHTVSRFRGALRAVGVAIVDGRDQPPLLVDWKVLLDASSRLQRDSLRPLAHWANAKNITPEMMSDATWCQFTQKQLTGRSQKSARQFVRRVVAIWAEVAVSHGLPACRNPLPYADRDTYCYPESAFHPDVIVGLDDVERSFTTIRRRGRLLSTKNARQHRYIIRLTLSAYCRATNTLPYQFTSIYTCFESNVVKTALEYMIKRAGSGAKRSNGAYEAARVMRNAARVALAPSDPQGLALTAMVKKLTPKISKTLTPKKSRCLSPFKNEALAAQVRGLPYRLYLKVTSGASIEKQTLTKLTHACGHELLMATSLWPWQVAALQIGDHLKITGTQEAPCYSIEISVDEDPHCTQRTFELLGPTRLVLERYLEHVRPMRPGSETNFLFPGRGNKGVGPSGFSQAIARLTSDEVQHRISGSQLRHAITVVVALSPAGGEVLARRFLGRRTPLPRPIKTAIDAWSAAAFSDGQVKNRRSKI